MSLKNQHLYTQSLDLGDAFIRAINIASNSDECIETRIDWTQQMPPSHRRLVTQLGGRSSAAQYPEDTSLECCFHNMRRELDLTQSQQSLLARVESFKSTGASLMSLGEVSGDHSRPLSR